ncbi:MULTISPECIES: DUF937 domain-containing protein [Mycolicibacterium]|jgi:hypothetical protein|uniref:DUF937 domain-containing protein n=4 Tax=Mycolicibacterium TaxID=1866885 RepID=A1TC29_MYCVP|nr:MULTISPECIES: DUF937 domain-containing protein [Mycolicibacterium]ABM14729.1 conserved hypothetical protein [Mycolicibacterium vanbaalenii PYR-1]MDN4520862.1 DUF937 domain-containing protein [Mycolicibacterium austroafricanum]MDW5612264.1 DUF937 domain-containing protein [Mycolicibacterium sp. D5.8-2]QRZ04665.1 DUF937 domain-containing protein [Mycolicibacterium austroafricanum]QZT55166.1 DUF937 domain-containing protein [Mycolicibacterium austroafricanum]
MADLDELYGEIPTRQIAARLGADEAEVSSAVKTLLPVLVGGLQQNALDPGTASTIASAANSHAGLLDGGVDVDQVDEVDGSKAVAKIFGGNDTGQVASALSGGGAGNSDLINRLLPILAPIVLAYIGRKLSGGQAQPQGQSGGGLGDILGGILGGGGQRGAGADNPLGSILGSVLGGDKGGPLGDILGGLLGGKK